MIIKNKDYTTEQKLNLKLICCIIITYNPDDVFFNLVKVIKNQVNEIIIVDNSSHLEIRDSLLKLEKDENIQLILNEENLGIACALNQGVIKAKEMNYDWVITFDQDSTPYNNIIDIICDVYLLYPDKSKIGAIGVNFPTDGGSYYPVSQTSKFHIKDYLITSGCLISIQAFFDVGGFREDFFIDDVDIEYSLRLKKYGKVSIITNEWGMNHKAGHPIYRRFLGLKLIASHHNSVRRYYMARNHIILFKDYIFKYPYFITKASFFFLLSFVNIILFENDKKNKMFASIKGIRDGILYSSHKTPLPNGNTK
jgi:rhamnosyltransferase